MMCYGGHHQATCYPVQCMRSIGQGHAHRSWSFSDFWRNLRCDWIRWTSFNWWFVFFVNAIIIFIYQVSSHIYTGIFCFPFYFFHIFQIFIMGLSLMVQFCENLVMSWTFQMLHRLSSKLVFSHHAYLLSQIMNIHVILIILISNVIHDVASFHVCTSLPTHLLPLILRSQKQSVHYKRCIG